MSSSDLEPCWLVGVGSALRGDDRVGLDVARAAYERLQAQGVPVRHFEAGADPLALLAELERMPRTVIVDAAQMGEEPGTVRVFGVGAAVRAIRSDPLVLHGFGLGEVLRMAEQLGGAGTKRRIVGIQPGELPLGPTDSLSGPLQSRFSHYVQVTCQEVLGDERENPDHR